MEFFVYSRLAYPNDIKCSAFLISIKVPKKADNRAERSVPGFLSLGLSGIRNAGRGVWSEIPLPKGIVFGPYKGTILKKRNEAKNSGYAWMVSDTQNYYAL